MTYRAMALGIAAFYHAGLRRLPEFAGPSQPDSKVLPPDQLLDFKALYAQNCAGCHGSRGSRGAAIPLADPVFLAIADDDAIRRTASNGVPGTPMPAFAQSAGGMLTDKQIDAIVGGIRSWAKPDGPAGSHSPSIPRRHPATRNVAPQRMRRTAPLVMAPTAAVAPRPVPSWMAHTSPW